MNRSNIARLGALAVLAVLAQAGIAQTAPTATVAAASAPGKAGVVANERVTAVVAAIDQATRKVTLREADGSLLSFTASPEVRNLAQVKVGDTVTLSHTTALVLELRKASGGIRERVETEGAARTAPGQMPGAVVGREVRVVADVVSINAQKKTVRLRGPQRTVDLRVDDPKQLAGIKVGDQVEATFIDAVALVVEPGAKPAAK
jgi:Cu/Ag efflux protein CusF